MSDRLRIGIVGAGAVGGYVGGRLLAADAADVVFVGRPRVAAEVGAGMIVKELGRGEVFLPAERVSFATTVEPLAGCDVALCCVKSAQTTEVARQMDRVLRPDALVASLQNGVRNAGVLRAELGGRPVIAGVVDFNVVWRGGAVFHRTTSGAILLERCETPYGRGLVRALASALDVEERADLTAAQWTKLLVNLNNAVSALSGVPTREIITSAGYRRIVAALVEEGSRVLRAAGIRPARFRGVPVGLMPFLLRLPTPLVRLVMGAQLRIDAEARSSMWADLVKGGPTEVDYLNGEIVRLAERVRVEAPFNRRIVKLVHAAERAGRGSPRLDADALWGKLSGAAL